MPSGCDWDTYEETQTPWVADGINPLEWMETHWRHFVWPIAKILRERMTPEEALTFTDGSFVEDYVYFLLNGYEIFYVGLSHDLDFRLTMHKQRFGSRLTHLSVIRTPPLYTTQIETLYIHHLRPPENVKYLPLSNLSDRILREVQTCRP